jgi:hypothetical protein
MMNETLQLSQLTPIAQGRMRLVYVHPKNPGLLIKVIRPDVIEQRWGRGAAWYKKRRRYGQYISYVREIEEYVATYAKYGGSLPFLQKIVGFEETDLGLGLVMEAVRDANGNLAPTLAHLLYNKGFTVAAQESLEVLIEQLMTHDLNIADLNPGNMVYINDARGTYFVLIDGLGVSTILPLKLISHRWNRRSKLSRVERLRSKIRRAQG